MSALKRSLTVTGSSPNASPQTTPTKRAVPEVFAVTILVVAATGRCVFPHWLNLKKNVPFREFLVNNCSTFCKFNGNENLWGNARLGADNVPFIFVGPRTFLTKISASLDDCRLVNALYFQQADDVDDHEDANKRISLNEALELFNAEDETRYQPQPAFQFAKAFEALAEDMLKQSNRIDTIEDSVQRLEELCRWNNTILHAIAAHLRIPQNLLAPPRRDEIN